MKLPDTLLAAKTRLAEQSRLTRASILSEIDPALWARVAAYPVFSFDIFETLVHRQGFLRPIDLFIEVAQRAALDWRLSPEDFARLRVQAERDARCRVLKGTTIQEVHLSEIYTHFNTLLPSRGAPMLPQKDLEHLQAVEIETELDFLGPITSVAAIYNAALAAGKRIVLTSDFYAPRHFLEQVLTRSGYTGYEKLFVSSEYRLSKHHGSLYSEVCKTLNVRPHDIVHFGDNRWSDGARALQMGIVNIPIQNPVNALTERLQLDWRTAAQPLASAINAELAEMLFGSGFARCVPEDTPVLERVGREVLGPLLLGLVGWLYADAKRYRQKFLHFCSRDGLIMKRAFDLYQRRHGEVTSTRYLKVSRQVIYRARAVSDPEIARSLFTQNWAQLSPAEALSRWGLNPAEFLLEIQSSGFASEDTSVAIGDRTGAARFERLFDSCRDALYACNLKHAQLFRDYLEQEQLTAADRSMIVDIGWHGSLQKGLSQTLADSGWNGQLEGRYLGLFLDPDSQASFNARGYLFSCDGTQRTRALRTSPSLVELLHTAGHGSISGYIREESGEILPVMEKRLAEEEQHVETIAPIQKAALDFIVEMLEKERFGSDLMDPDDAFRGLDRLLNRPDPDELEVLGSLRIAANYGPDASSISLTELSKDGYRLWNK